MDEKLGVDFTVINGKLIAKEKPMIEKQIAEIKTETRNLIGKWIDDPEAVRFLANMSLLRPDQRHNVYRLAKLMANAGRAPGETIQGELL